MLDTYRSRPHLHNEALGRFRIFMGVLLGIIALLVAT
jgi:hypothetical protein